MARRNAINGRHGKAVWADTQGQLAILSPKDQWHRKAVACQSRLAQQGIQVVTSRRVLLELLNAMSKPPLRRLAVGWIGRVLAHPRYTILQVEAADWEAGFGLYSTRPDKEWSLVDCISILHCRRLGVQEVFAGDKHFEQAGLSILLT